MTVDGVNPVRPAGRGGRGVAVALTATGLALAGGVHLGLAAQHGVGEHGIRFLAAGGAQVAAAAAIWGRPTSRRLLAGGGLSVLAAVAWLVTRTSVVGDAEPIDALGAVTAVVEVATAAVALSALRVRTVAIGARSTGRDRWAASAVGGVVALGVTVGWAGPSTHDDHHHGGHEAVPVVASADERPSIFGDLFADHHATAGPSTADADATVPTGVAGAHPHDEGDHSH